MCRFLFEIKFTYIFRISAIPPIQVISAHAKLPIKTPIREYIIIFVAVVFLLGSPLEATNIIPPITTPITEPRARKAKIQLLIATILLYKLSKVGTPRVKA